ncbi:hypothetical protein N9M16_09810, partial [Candidatus Dependentiae bacterium]|nr:hypothetical protein [Candidatus Dependentiae bacterium]
AQLAKLLHPEHCTMPLGIAVGIRHMYQMKYCAVETLLRATNPIVCMRRQNGKSFANLKPTTVTVII